MSIIVLVDARAEGYTYFSKVFVVDDTQTGNDVTIERVG